MRSLRSAAAVAALVVVAALLAGCAAPAGSGAPSAGPTATDGSVGVDEPEDLNRIPAPPAAWWDAGDIVSDAEFFDGDAMTVAQIEAFLVAQNPICDTYHQKSARTYDSGPPYTLLDERSWAIPPLDALGYTGTQD